MRYERVITGTFINRPNRFIAEVEIDGNTETVHVKNTGARSQFIGRSGDLFTEMIGDRTPGAEIITRVAERLEPRDGIEAVGTVRRTAQPPPKKRKPKEGDE